MPILKNASEVHKSINYLEFNVLDSDVNINDLWLNFQLSIVVNESIIYSLSDVIHKDDLKLMVSNLSEYNYKTLQFKPMEPVFEIQIHQTEEYETVVNCSIDIGQTTKGVFGTERIAFEYETNKQSLNEFSESLNIQLMNINSIKN